MSAYLMLFAATFAAATIFPFYSEVLFVGLLARDYTPWLLVTVASLGNTLGAVVNWVLGRYLLHFSERRWFPFKPGQLGRAQVWFQRYGVYSLLLAWMPLGGDALTFIAGMMRVPLGLFFALTLAGKSLRFIALAYFTGWVLA